MTAEQNYTSLEDPHAFPPFNSCPHDVHCLIPKSWPDRHWCFLGEIEDISGIGRLCLDVRDREGTPARIYFYLDKIKPGVVCVVINPAKVTYPDHPNVPAPLVRKGNTIAVLYAEQHRWLAENSTGVRIEDGDTVKIFPCTLKQLLSISDRICQSVKPAGDSGSRACRKCDANEATSLQVCSACRLVWYCGKDCQKADWSNEGHKLECKLGRQVKGLMQRDWSRFETWFKFPPPPKSWC